MQSGGRAAKRKAEDAIPEAIPEKIYKGTVMDMFKTNPVDATTQSTKWEEYTQKATTMDPLQIDVPRSKSFMDTQSIMFEYEVEFLRNDNATLLTAANKVAPINLTGQSLIKEVALYVNDTLVTQNTEYNHYTAYFNRLLNYSEEDKKEWLSLEGWATDTAGKFDDTNPLDRPIVNAVADAGGNAYNPATLSAWLNTALSRETPNAGAKERHSVCCQNRKVKFLIQPMIPLFKCGRYFPTGIELKFRIKWNSPELVFMAANANNAGATAPRFRIVEGSPKIWVKHVMVNSELHLDIETQMMGKQHLAIFPHLHERIVTTTIVNDRRRGRFDDCFNGYRPNYMVVGFLRGDAFNGNYTRNPFNFCDMNQSRVRVTVDQEEIPYRGINLTDHFKEEGYKTLMLFSGKSFDSPPIGLSRKTYKDGNYLLLFNFNPDGDQNDNYDFNRNTGVVNIEVEFSADTADNTTMVVYGYFEQQGWLDGNKNLTMRYNY